MRPLIGISQCLDDGGRWKAGRTYQYADAAYARAVAESGATPVHLPCVADPVDIVARLDGLLLPGGDDLPPPPGTSAGPDFDPAPIDQIAFDTALLDAALHRTLPVLGICYGMQLLALRSGGALHYDIATALPGSAPHQLGTDERHRVVVEPATRLADLFGAGPLDVNSRHHQAVADPGPKLRASARAGDGLIEAIESKVGPFCIGVQWHPESLEAEHRAQLFGGFVAACAR